MKSRRIASFTLIEVLIVLVICSIVISLSVYVYNSFQKIFITNMEKVSYTNEIILKLNKLENDFNKAIRIKFENEKFLVEHYNGLKQTFSLSDFFGFKNEENNSEKKVNHIINLSYLLEQNTNLVKSIAFDIISFQLDTLHIKLNKEYSPYSISNE